MKRLDDAIYRFERAAVAAILLAMGAFVFLDVVHRLATRQGGYFASPVRAGLTAALVVALAQRSRGRTPWPAALAAGAFVTIGLKVFVVAIPNGLVWSQTAALSLTLWLGMFGASLAAHDRRHLALDIGTQIWPKAWVGRVTAVGHVATAAFCVLLAGLGLRSMAAHHALWVATDGAGGNLAGLAIPMWFPAAALPYGATVLALRFASEGWQTWHGTLPAGVEDPLHHLGLAGRDGEAP